MVREPYGCLWMDPESAVFFPAKDSGMVGPIAQIHFPSIPSGKYIFMPFVNVGTPEPGVIAYGRFVWVGYWGLPEGSPIGGVLVFDSVLNFEPVSEALITLHQVSPPFDIYAVSGLSVNIYQNALLFPSANVNGGYLVKVG